MFEKATPRETVEMISEATLESSRKDVKACVLAEIFGTRQELQNGGFHEDTTATNIEGAAV